LRFLVLISKLGVMLKLLSYKLRKIYNPYRYAKLEQPIDGAECLVVTDANNFYRLKYYEELRSFIYNENGRCLKKLGLHKLQWQNEKVKKWKFC
jgi:hypothetical protein